jgi:hypothetical protein
VKYQGDGVQEKMIFWRWLKAASKGGVLIIDLPQGPGLT